MPQVVSLVILALAVSFDGFGVGTTYGLRKIRIPMLSICIISLFSGCVIFIAMQIGALLTRLFSPQIASCLGAAILIGIGFWTLWQTIRQAFRQTFLQNRRKPAGTKHIGKEMNKELVEANVKKTVLRIKFRQFSLVVQILRSPSVADVDQSGIISASEATLLGVALSLDSFGAGLGAALIGLNPLLTAAAIVISGGIFITLGLKTGIWLSEWKWVGRLAVMPGLILIALGMMKLLNT
ncbi:MAG TPA: sporulation membrane protein YtaF [Bacilli bacterium]